MTVQNENEIMVYANELTKLIQQWDVYAYDRNNFEVKHGYTGKVISIQTGKDRVVTELFYVIAPDPVIFSPYGDSFANVEDVVKYIRWFTNAFRHADYQLNRHS